MRRNHVETRVEVSQNLFLFCEMRLAVADAAKKGSQEAGFHPCTLRRREREAVGSTNRQNPIHDFDASIAKSKGVAKL